MQFAGDAQALLHAHVEFLGHLPRDLMEAKLIQRPEQYQKIGRARRTEPSGLVVGRGDGKLQGCASFVPHTVVIRCHDLEA